MPGGSFPLAFFFSYDATAATSFQPSIVVTQSFMDASLPIGTFQVTDVNANKGDDDILSNHLLLSKSS